MDTKRDRIKYQIEKTRRYMQKVQIELSLPIKWEACILGNRKKPIPRTGSR